MRGERGRSLSSFRTLAVLSLSGFLGGIDGGRGERGNLVADIGSVPITRGDERRLSRPGTASLDGRRMVVGRRRLRGGHAACDGTESTLV